MSPDEAIRTVLARHPRIDLAILFGSLAQGRGRPDSDLDLAAEEKSRSSPTWPRISCRCASASWRNGGEHG